MFTALYINHSRLSPVTKLYHLRNKTRGEAGAIVRRYTLSQENFELAWKALEERYENKRVLVDNQIKILFDIPAAKSEDSDSLKRIQSSVNDLLATLRTLGVEVESWNPILVRLISTKLPEQTLALWEQSLKSPRELPEWSQMSQFLVDRYEAVERLTSIRKSKELTISHGTRPNVQTYVSQGSYSALCKLCKKDHTIRECPKFKSFTVQQRLDFVFKNKICNNCLATSHTKASCKSRHTCLHCKKTHHTLLHLGHKSPSSIETTESAQHSGTKDLPDSVQINPCQKTYSRSDCSEDERPGTSKGVHANHSTSNEQILLRTALVQLEHKGEIFTVRALIDPGIPEDIFIRENT